MVVNCHPDEHHLFEKDYEMPFVLPGMLLMNVPGIPNVVGPAAEFDNRVIRVIWDGEINRVRCQLFGPRCPTETIEEVRKQFPEWNYIRKLDNVKELNPQDFLRDS